MKKYARVVCALMIFILAATLSISVFANESEHVHSKNCLYSCELDTITYGESLAPDHEHVNHSGSENCIYCCDHDHEKYEEPFPWTIEMENQFKAELRAELEKAASREEKNAIIAEYFNYPLEYIEELQRLSTPSAGKGLCEHEVLPASCQGNHYGQHGCKVWCRRPGICIYCHELMTVLIDEDSHDWSVGWCGQTCKRCGKIELFHPPGGCPHCS